MSLLSQIASANLKVLRPSGGCHNCPLSPQLPNTVPAALRPGKVLFIGERPGEADVREGEPFSGKAGEKLRTAALLAGVPEPWSFTNLTHCRPPDNRLPKPKEVESCMSQYILDEARDYSYVVLLGNTPLTAFFPKAKGRSFRGNFALHPDFPGVRFYNMYHPAYLFRRPDLEDEFDRHMERLGRVARGEGPPAWKLVRGSAGIEALKAMVAGPLISADLETNGVDSWLPTSVTKSFCATADGVTVAAFTDADPQWQMACALLDNFLADPSKGIVGSYVSFDVEWRERESGIRAKLPGIHDVAILWYEAGQYKHPSLKMLVSSELDGYRNLVHLPHEEKDEGSLLDYNAEDVVYSYQLFVKGMQKVKPKTRDLVTRVMGPMSLVYTRASTNGIYIRENYRQQLIEELTQERKDAVRAWREEDPEFVPSEHESGKGLHTYLFSIRGLPVLGKTKSEKPSTDKNHVKAWIRDGAVQLRHLLKIREVDKLLSTFVLPLGDQMDPNWRIHPKHWMTSTDTSRPSSSDPNVYNIPRDRRIRNLYGSPPGSMLIESDLSQIEFRIMVCLAKDEAGIAGYMRHDDAHTMTARTISGNPNPSKEERSQAKPVNFGNLYGAHWRTAQAQAINDYGVQWTDQQAQAFQDAFFSTYKQIRPYHEWSKQKLVANRGWFESVTGHVFHYRDWDHPEQSVRDHAFRSALNAEAQGPGANITYLIAVATQRMLMERKIPALMVNSVYDSVMLELKEPKLLEDVIEVLNLAAEEAHRWVSDWFAVPLVLEHATGDTWGELEEMQLVRERIRH